MISCTEFIPVYNELFKFLHARAGKEATVRFWEYLSDTFLDNLRNLAASRGLAGCFEYWSRTLTEEAADFRMKLDESKGLLEIEMRRCPSMGRLLDDPDLTPYTSYCEHCDTLYRRVLEPLGFHYEIDLSRCREARCRIRIQQVRGGTTKHA